MTAMHSNIPPLKDVQHCSSTNDYEITVNGQVIGYAPTQPRGAEIANEHVYHLLTRDHLDPADLSQEDADAILAALMADMPVRVSLAEHFEPECLEAQASNAETRQPLLTPPPIHQIVREVPWLLGLSRFAA